MTGTYFYRLETADYSETKRKVLVKLVLEGDYLREHRTRTYPFEEGGSHEGQNSILGSTHTNFS